MDGKELRVVEVRTGKELRVLRGHEFPIYAVAYSPDGQRILSGDGSCLRLWDARNGTQLLCLDGRNGNLSSLAMTPNGRWAVSGHSAGSGLQRLRPRDLFLWDLKTGKVVCHDRIILHRWVTQQLFAGSYNLLPDQVREPLPRSVRDMFKGPTYREVCRWEGQQHVNCVACSSDGKNVICGCADGRAHILDVRTGKEICSLGRKTNKAVQGVTFSPDGERVLVGSDGGEVYLWHIGRRRELHSLRGHKGAVYSLAISPHGQRAMSGGEDQTVRLWDLETGKELACFCELKVPITSVVFSPDSRFAACADDAGHVCYWTLPD
jgi:WD40 repeat protein